MMRAVSAAVVVLCTAGRAFGLPQVHDAGGLVPHRGLGRAASWCAGQPLRFKGAAHADQDTINEARIELGVSRGAEFRGAYRDLTLWVETSRSQVHHCKAFAEHHQGNDGLWIVEYDTKTLMEEESLRMRKLGVQVVYSHQLTMIVNGGEEVPDILGYDACGMEVDLRFISVPSRGVRGPRSMTAATKSHFMGLAKDKSSARMELLERVSADSLVALIGNMETYYTRNSFSGDGPLGDNGLNQAADWAEEKFREYGCVEVSRPAFREDMTPQVVCEIPGQTDPDRIVVVGAHYDSRGTSSTSPTQRAPGADDNGSGSAALIEFARVIQETGTTFRHTLRLMLFTGEEQGLIGSRNLASQYASEGQQIIAMFNADMIGYKRPGFDITLAYMNRFVDMDVTEISMEITRTWVPELPVDFTSGCCSDQQSFYENGFPSVGFFENPGSRVYYPEYHTSDDLLENLEPQQIYLLSKATMASAAVFAEPLEAK